VHSDALATTLACAALLALVRQLDGDARGVRAGAGLGLLLGLGLATKLSTLFLLPLAGGVAVVVLRCDRSRWPAVAAALAVAAAVALPTLLRNHALYGDALALGVHDATFAPIPPEARLPWLFFGYLPTIFPSLLGNFGWFALPPARPLVWAGGLVVALALAGWLRGRRDAAVRTPVRHRALLFAALLLVFAATTHFNWKAPQPQGRLLFPAIGPAAVLLAAGLLQLAHGWRARRAVALALPATALWVFVGWFLPAFDPALAPAPAWHRSVVDARRPDAARATIGWQVGELPPSATPPLLRWSDPTAPADARYALYAHDEHGRVWLAAFEWSSGALALTGGEAAMPDAAFGLLPTDRDVLLTLRRAPVAAGDDPAALPHSPPLRLRRLR
jgi:4-amino-4-deoxy-L-arabinose transferase-like glycosyltransferase